MSWRPRGGLQIGHSVASVAMLSLVGACGGSGEPEADPYHFDETTFVGTVTELDPYDVNQVTVDQADVSLDLIYVIDACYDPAGSYREAALAAKVDLLPIGTRVLVVRAEDGGDAAFVHLLPAGSNTPDPPAPAASANELLVASGHWEPSGFQIADEDDPTGVYGIQHPDWLSPVQAEYAPLIIAAGNSAKSARIASHGRCVAELEKEEAERRAWLEEAERQAEEDDRRRRTSGGGGGYCRDGDGDGICYED
jgi:hypothetical protein